MYIFSGKFSIMYLEMLFGAFGTCRLELCLLSENSCFVIVCFKIDLNLQHIVYFVKSFIYNIFTVEMYCIYSHLKFCHITYNNIWIWVSMLFILIYHPVSKVNIAIYRYCGSRIHWGWNVKSSKI